MLAMSAGIAMLGMLLSSPAVVIGAMLIAPLMGPIIGAGFALAIGDYKWLRGSVRALAAGMILAVAICALIVFVSPIQTVTPEIAARTRPNLFDLAVAIFSALAGAYSMIRGREGTIVGVAIATALMPPLAAVGFGLATTNWTVFSGALLLFVTNLMTIALVATVMARIYGFSAALSETQTRLQTMIIVGVFVALAIPLYLALKQIAWESIAQRQIRDTVLSQFDGDARISQLDFDLEADPVSVDTTVLTPTIHAGAQRATQDALADLLEEQVDLRLTQFRVGTAAQAEAAELAAASARQEQQAEAAMADRARTLARDLALVAGVDPSDVLVDRSERRALVRARPLPGATLATYRTLEARIAGAFDGWRVAIQPPLAPLPSIAFAQGEPTDEGRAALALISWAAQRRDMPVMLQGGTPATRELAAAILRQEGIDITLSVGGPLMQANWRTDLEGE
ncbi:DUF389 domain-containing protein [Aurantiacibacter spongiae]|uniref:DUF389 domain-containing protein n=2 Tax=Aurantiacibacter spongiae TaxID=2488860 RepID=A0A3N5DP43_9SPHN|nr:DUF389 domain-containing protein [Aurantiacibacter spongiae]